MTKTEPKTAAMAASKNEKYESPFDKNRTTLINVKAAKQFIAPNYTSKTSLPFNPDSERIDE